jgi:hypothetical protein
MLIRYIQEVLLQRDVDILDLLIQVFYIRFRAVDLSIAAACKKKREN